MSSWATVKRARSRDVIRFGARFMLSIYRVLPQIKLVGGGVVSADPGTAIPWGQNSPRTMTALQFVAYDLVGVDSSDSLRS